MIAGRVGSAGDGDPSGVGCVARVVTIPVRGAVKTPVNSRFMADARPNAAASLRPGQAEEPGTAVPTFAIGSRFSKIEI